MVEDSIDEKETLTIKKHKEKYLGYDVYLEYLIVEEDNRYSLSYRVIEEFNPAFSNDVGCVAISDYKSIRSYKRKETCILKAKEHFDEVTVCDLRRDFLLGD